MVVSSFLHGVRGAQPKQIDVLNGTAVPTSDFIPKMFTFVVEAIHPNRDFVLLCLKAGEPDAKHHFNIATSPVTRRDAGRSVLILEMHMETLQSSL
jgi:hypothetical protein